LILKHNPAKAFFINESLRLDWDENYGWIAVPQFNLSWTPAKFTYRFAAGRSFRDADFTERYNNYNKALVTGGSIGNPALKSESSWNIEAGADFLRLMRSESAAPSLPAGTKT
jgi:iron complex outermembrane receptor protein